MRKWLLASAGVLGLGLLVTAGSVAGGKKGDPERADTAAEGRRPCRQVCPPGGQPLTARAGS